MLDGALAIGRVTEAVVEGTTGPIDDAFAPTDVVVVATDAIAAAGVGTIAVVLIVTGATDEAAGTDVIFEATEATVVAGVTFGVTGVAVVTTGAVWLIAVVEATGALGPTGSGPTTAADVAACAASAVVAVAGAGAAAGLAAGDAEATTAFAAEVARVVVLVEGVEAAEPSRDVADATPLVTRIKMHVAKTPQNNRRVHRRTELPILLDYPAQCVVNRN